MDAILLAWLIIGIAFAVAEVMTLTFYLLPFALGALCALIAHLFGASLVIQVVIFLIVSVILIFLVKPFARKVTSGGPKQTSGVDRLTDAPGIIIDPITIPGTTGKLLVHGEEWLCASADPHLTYKTGDAVTISHVDGTKAMIMPTQDEMQDNSTL